MKNGIVIGRCCQGIAALWVLLVLMCGSMPALGQSDPSNDYSWHKIGTSAISIDSYYGSAANVAIPNQIQGLPVVEIASWAFSSTYNLATVTMPDTVTNIGEYAFYYCSTLTKVTLSKGVARIGSSCFAGCSKLATIAVDPASPYFSSVGGVLFDSSQTSLISYPPGKGTSYTMPNTATNIENSAFYNNYNLASITLSTNLIRIGEEAFEYCSALKTITLPNSLTTIERYAFVGCRGLTTLRIPKGVTFIGDSAFAYTGLTDITVDSLNPAFCSVSGGLYDKAQTKLISYFGRSTTVSLPATLTTIGETAFYGSPMASINVPKNVTNIAYTAFYNCSSFTNFQVDPLNSSYSSPGGVLFDKSGTVLLTCPSGKTGKYSIPSGTTSIGDYAFYICLKLTNVVIPVGVTNIGVAAFVDCITLTSLVIPATVKEIGSQAFYYCQALRSIYFEGDAPTISRYSYLFESDYLLTVYTRPESTGWDTNNWDTLLADNPPMIWPKLEIRREGANLLLTWPHGLLQQATSPTGPWTTRTDASSPLIVAPSNPPKFYRLLLD